MVLFNILSFDENRHFPKAKSYVRTILIDVEFIKICSHQHSLGFEKCPIGKGAKKNRLKLKISATATTTTSTRARTSRSFDCKRAKVESTAGYPKDKHMEFNFSKRKPISGTLCITIQSLIRLTFAMAINTSIAFILFDWGFLCVCVCTSLSIFLSVSPSLSRTLLLCLSVDSFLRHSLVLFGSFDNHHVLWLYLSNIKPPPHLSGQLAERILSIERCAMTWKFEFPI